MAYPLLLEERFRLRAVQQRESREQPGLRATARRHRHRTGRVADRPPGARIENVAVAHTILQKIPTRVPAGRERPALQIEQQARMALAIRALDADLPTPLCRRSICPQITAEVDQERRVATRRESIVGEVHGVFLANTAEIDLH